MREPSRMSSKWGRWAASFLSLLDMHVAAFAHVSSCGTPLKFSRSGKRCADSVLKISYPPAWLTHTFS